MKLLGLQHGKGTKQLFYLLITIPAKHLDLELEYGPETLEITLTIEIRQSEFWFIICRATGSTYRVTMARQRSNWCKFNITLYT
jgi:hypothetical protein